MRSPHDKGVRSPQKKNALLLSIVLSIVAFLVQVLGSLYTGSIALLGDTAHVFTDLFSLIMSYLALVLAARPSSAEIRSFGLYRLEVLAAFLNGLLLVLVSLWLIWESVERILYPKPILAVPLVLVSLFGLLMNLISALVLSRAMKEKSTAEFKVVEENPFHLGHHNCGHHHGSTHASHAHHHSHNDRNIQSAFLHVLSDAVGSVAVIVGAIFIYYFNWTWVDPLLGIVLSLVILRWGGNLLIETTHVLLEGTPNHVKPEEILKELKSCDEKIVKIDDLHVWEITSSMYAATAEVEVKEMSLQESDQLRQKLNKILEKKYSIAHTVLAIKPQR